MVDKRVAAKSSRDVYRCSECGHSAPKWFGKCPECSAWSSAETAAQASADAPVISSLAEAGPAPNRLASGHGEIDRVLGGGLVLGEVALLGGEPGVGKSTLILQFLDGLLARGHRSLLVSGEESLHQVGLRAARLDVDTHGLRMVITESLPATIAAWMQEQPDVLVVDSIQTIVDPTLEQGPGSLVQVRECATALVRQAKASGTALVLIGHVTKDGSLAGPKALEHIVDAVLSLEGERGGTMRLLRATKNRFGSCEELGVFSMTPGGLEAVVDPSAMFLTDRRAEVGGSVVFPAIEGVRPMLVELQALATDSDLAQPRRVAVGIESRRLALTCAVLADKAATSMTKKDVFVAAAGGLTISEPAADLPLCLALASAATGAVVEPRTVAVGEVGLSGEIRKVPALERRLVEARRLGFNRSIVPASCTVDVPGMELLRADDLRSALRLSMLQ